MSDNDKKKRSNVDVLGSFLEQAKVDRIEDIEHASTKRFMTSS